MSTFRPLRRFFALCALAFAPMLMPGVAQAIGHEVCNETSYVIYLATGVSKKQDVRTEGWVRLRPGQCRIALPAPFSDVPYYAYGYSSDVHAGGRQQWGGHEAFCVDMTGNFSFGGREDCAALGLQTQHFNVIDVNPPDGGRTVLSEPDNFGTRAEFAGIQRLLKDNGYSVRVVDGYDGRRTRSAIKKFALAQNISPRPEGARLIDALEKAAQDNLAQTGLRVCNKTPSPIWTAYGRRKGRNWQSRGWWKIAPKACTSLLSGILTDKNIYVYAGLETNTTERPLLGANVKFCVLDILFSISGKEKCKLRGYEARPFALYRNPTGKGLTIELGPEDFAKMDILADLRR